MKPLYMNPKPNTQPTPILARDSCYGPYLHGVLVIVPEDLVPHFWGNILLREWAGS